MPYLKNHKRYRHVLGTNLSAMPNFIFNFNTFMGLIIHAFRVINENTYFWTDILDFGGCHLGILHGHIIFEKSGVWRIYVPIFMLASQSERILQYFAITRSTRADLGMHRDERTHCTCKCRFIDEMHETCQCFRLGDQWEAECTVFKSGIVSVANKSPLDLLQARINTAEHKTAVAVRGENILCHILCPIMNRVFEALNIPEKLRNYAHTSQVAKNYIF